MRKWTHQDGDQYIVKGEARNGTKFRRVYTNYPYAMAINLWKGRVWVVRNGRRTCLKIVD